MSERERFEAGSGPMLSDEWIEEHWRQAYSQKAFPALTHYTAAVERAVVDQLWSGQAASGSSHTARSDVLSIDVVEQRLLTWRQRFMNKSGDRLALDDFMGQESIDDLIDFVCSPPAQSAEQGATPPEPAAQIRALISKWRHAADHLGLEGLASLADCADELESALAASPQPAVPTVKRDYCPEKLKPGGCQLHNLHCGYPACNAAPAAEGGAS